MMLLFSRFFVDDDATTSIEYAIIAAGVAVAIAAAINTLGLTVLATKFQAVANAMTP